MGSREEAAEITLQVERYLEDLIAFEGSQFLVPARVREAERPQEKPGQDRPSPAAQELEAFHQQICECTRCSLGHTRQNFVFGTGHPQADIMFIGEAPGAEEDRQGQPFVGSAGQLLTRIIEAMQLHREDVYICNMLKCRPPNNRDPQPEEIELCEPYLKRQIEIVQPRIICTLGRVAAQALLKTTESMGGLRGQLHEYEGIPVIATYHPAALLRNPQWKRATWEDMKRLRHEYDGLEL